MYKTTIVQLNKPVPVQVVLPISGPCAVVRFADAAPVEVKEKPGLRRKLPVSARVAKLDGRNKHRITTYIKQTFNIEAHYLSKNCHEGPVRKSCLTNCQGVRHCMSHLNQQKLFK